MFENMGGGFDQAFPRTPESQPQPIRLRKTLQQRLVFYSVNALVLPLVALCYLSISAEGLRQMMSVFAMRLYSLPVPGIGLMRQFDGWNRLDLAIVMSLLLYGAVSYIWFRTFKELMGFGELVSQRSSNPILVYLIASVVGVVILGDCFIFYYGLESKASSGWGNTPAFVPAAATLVYMSLLALVGAYHADYHYSGSV